MTPGERAWLEHLAAIPYATERGKRRAARACMLKGWTEWVCNADGKIVSWMSAPLETKPIGERITDAGRAALEKENRK